MSFLNNQEWRELKCFGAGFVVGFIMAILLIVILLTGVIK